MCAAAVTRAIAVECCSLSMKLLWRHIERIAGFTKHFMHER